MDITSANFTDPPLVLWFKIAAQYYLRAKGLGMTSEPPPFPTDTELVLMRKTVNYTAFLATA